VFYGIVKRAFGAILIIGCASAATAGERTDFRVNDDGSGSLQSDPRIAVGYDRTFVVTWVDRRGSTNDIYLQRYDSDGLPVGPNQLVNDDTNSSYQFDPAIAVDESGYFSMIWQDYRNDSYPFGPDLYFQRFDSSMTADGANLLFTTELPDTIKKSPDIAVNRWGAGVVVWADYRSNNWDIYGQRLASDGSPVGSNFMINSDTVTAQQHAPRVAIDPQGWFVVTWYDNRNGNDDVFARRFDSLGVPTGGDIQVNVDPDEIRQGYPDVAADGAGHFTIVWTDWCNGDYPANPDIYSRKYDTTMTPVTDTTRINTDDTQHAQRDPAIAADRLGNVAIIWADSTGNSWDIMGQMIDVDGVVREANFTANTLADSAQHQPGVALDGQYRYICWTDDRNGDLDIYASIEKYNDIALVILPSLLQFDMNHGGSLPVAQDVSVEQYGYNPTVFDVVSTVDWISASPVSGTTPQTVTVSINTDTLSGGTWLGELIFVDRLTSDSSVALAVRLDVNEPVISLSIDTLSLTAFEGADEDRTAAVVVTNTGTGSFAWSASEGESWLSLSPESGSDGDTVTVACNALNLTEASYNTWVVFTAAEATGSPDSLLVILDVTSAYPYAQPQPDSFYFYTYDLTSVDTFCVVNDIGTGSLDWTASPADSWLGLTGTSGLDGDQIGITIANLALDYGLYTTSIEIIDSNAFNISTLVPVVLRYYEHSTDTIRVDSGLVTAGQPINLPVSATLDNNVDTILIPLGFDTSAVTVDSVLVGQTLPDPVDFTAVVDSNSGLISIEIAVNQADTFITAGEYHLAELFLTAANVDVWTSIDTVYNDSLALAIRIHNSSRVVPDFVPSCLTIGNPTSVGDDIAPALPLSFELKQNRPNPFNLSTIIDYYLPRRADVTLEVFNILGQRIGQFVEQSQPAGYHKFEWTGRLCDGQVAASGIYFYRLRAGSESQVRKMVLIK